jgi:putative SOS response-associated peptidase YedK
MCGRTNRASGQETIKAINNQLGYDIELKVDFEEIKNLPPTLGIPIISQKEPHLLQTAYWGLVPSYAKQFKMDYTTFNATCEKLFTPGLWSKLVEKKHCVIAVKSFYEWQYDDPIKKKGKHIFNIHTANSPLTYMAGLYEDWTDRVTGEVKQSCTIITNPANEVMAKIHNTKARMPAFLNPNNIMDWINPEIDIEERMKLIHPVANDFIEAEEILEID